MKKEESKQVINNLNNKSKFFACYWGQSVFRKNNWNLDARPNYPSWDVDEQSKRPYRLPFCNGDALGFKRRSVVN